MTKNRLGRRAYRKNLGKQYVYNLLRNQNEGDQDRMLVQRGVDKKKLTRRKLLTSIGVVTVGSIATYEVAPKVSQLSGDVVINLEQRLHDAFNRGFIQGNNSVRQELVVALENIDGLTIDNAITSAKVIRMAYNTFILPIEQSSIGSTRNFLSSMAHACSTARSWLGTIGQDNNILASIQSIIDAWVTQVSRLPKQLESFTDADVGGTQIYLEALQNKLNDERAKSTNQQGK